MIRTDGISICVLFVLLENGKPMSKSKGKKLKGFLDSNYIENVKNIIFFRFQKTKCMFNLTFLVRYLAKDIPQTGMLEDTVNWEGHVGGRGVRALTRSV